MHLSHPLRVSLCQIVVNRHHMYALSFQGIQISGQNSRLRLTFTRAHLSDTPLVKNDTAKQLHPVMLRVQHTPGRFPGGGIGLRQQVVQRSALFQPLFVFRSLSPQSFIGKRLHFRPKRFNLIYQRRNALHFPLAVCTKYFVNYFHGLSIPFYGLFSLVPSRIVQCQWTNCINLQLIVTDLFHIFNTHIPYIPELFIKLLNSLRCCFLRTSCLRKRWSSKVISYSPHQTGNC